MVTKIMVTTKMMATNGISGNGGSNVKRRKKNKYETKRMRNTRLMRDSRNKGVEYMYSEVRVARTDPDRTEEGTYYQEENTYYPDILDPGPAAACLDGRHEEEIERKGVEGS